MVRAKLSDHDNCVVENIIAGRIARHDRPYSNVVNLISLLFSTTQTVEKQYT